MKENNTDEVSCATNKRHGIKILNCYPLTYSYFERRPMPRRDCEPQPHEGFLRASPIDKTSDGRSIRPDIFLANEPDFENLDQVFRQTETAE